MSGQAPNSTNITRTKRAIQAFSHLVVHPEYEYWREDWIKIRDALAGEREVKRKGAAYLAPMPGTDPNDRDGRYAQYLRRAVFYNMSQQTLAGMVGQVFRRPPTIRWPAPMKATQAKFEAAARRFAKDGTPHQGFAKTVASEQIALGRFGALVDVSPTVRQGEAQPFVVGYSAENIIDWDIEDVDGFYQPTRILLREYVRDNGIASDQNDWINQGEASRAARMRGPDGKPLDLRRALSGGGGGYSYCTIYRELLLTIGADGERIYEQRVYKEDPTGLPYDVFTPVIRGNTLPFIPFVFFGATSNAGDCEKPPLLDIVNLNFSHYTSYAELEHGRFYTALPTYYSPGNQDDDTAEYHIGPGMVWQVPSGETPGILEYKGEGLKTLERALNEKEAQIAAIGGRLMPGMSKSVSESDNQSQMREANEQSLLLNVIMALEEGMALLFRYWLMFRDIPLRETVTLRYEIDTTFLTTAIDARALRAIQQLYEGGLLPIDALYEVFVKFGVIPDSTTLEEFTAKMSDKSFFIGEPDAIAARSGYTNRAQQLEQERLDREEDFRKQELEFERRRLEIEEKKLAIAAAVDATTVSATRKLGDPEQAAPSSAEQAQVAAQREATRTAAQTAKTVAASRPKPTAPKK